MFIGYSRGFIGSGSFKLIHNYYDSSQHVLTAVYSTQILKLLNELNKGLYIVRFWLSSDSDVMLQISLK